MNHKDIDFLFKIVETLKEIDPLGYQATEKNLMATAKILSEEDGAGMVASLKSMDASTFCTKGGPVKLARAWLVIQAGRMGLINQGWSPPTDKERGDLLGRLNGLSADQVRGEISDAISGRVLVNKVAEAQNNPERLKWIRNQFTDPKEHKASDFLYLIVGLRDDAVKLQPKNAEQEAYYTDPKGPFEGFAKRNEDGGVRLFATRRYLKNPETLCAQVICCSVISDKHTKTYQDMCFGFILDVPKELIISASAKDDSTSSWIYKATGADLHIEACPIERLLQVEDFLDNLVGKYQKSLSSPDLILQKSQEQGCHNEVNVLGSNGSGLRVKLGGIFVKVTPGMKLCVDFWQQCQSDGLGALILTCASANKVPIVPIPESNIKGSDKDFKSWVDGK